MQLFSTIHWYSPLWSNLIWITHSRANIYSCITEGQESDFFAALTRDEMFSATLQEPCIGQLQKVACSEGIIWLSKESIAIWAIKLIENQKYQSEFSRCVQTSYRGMCLLIVWLGAPFRWAPGAIVSPARILRRHWVGVIIRSWFCWNIQKTLNPAMVFHNIL